MVSKDITKYCKKVSGKKKNDIFMFTLSTCGWCMKTKKLLKDLGVEHSYIDVDLLEGEPRDLVMKEFDKWNENHSFPTIVVNNEKCIMGFQEDLIRKIAK